MKIIIPDNLNLKKVKEDFPPSFNFDDDRAFYLLSLISYLQYKDRSIAQQEYVPLNSSIIQKNNIRNFAAYWRYFVDAGVWEYQEYSTDKKKSRSFRFTDTYIAKLKTIEPPKSKFWKIIQNNEVKRRSKGLEKDWLYSWFNNNLTINKEAAIDYCIRSYWSDAKKDQKYVYDLIFSIERIAAGDFYFKYCDYGRLHTNLTNLHTPLRAFVSYDGQSLANIDIVNSQPYFSSLLLTPEFWCDSNQFNVNDVTYSIRRQLKSKISEKWVFNNLKVRQPDWVFSHSTSKAENWFDFQTSTISNSLVCNYTNNFSSLMLTKTSELFTVNDLADYRLKVEKGEFYEYFQQKLAKTDESYASKTRSEIKEVFYTAIFSKRIPENKLEGASLVFHRSFPQVSKLFRKIKYKGHSLLACSLQCIESQIILGHVVKAIQIKYPNTCLFTIHDSIVVPSEIAEAVKTIFKSTIDSILGSSPKFKVDYWTSDEADNQKTALSAIELPPRDNNHVQP